MKLFLAIPATPTIQHLRLLGLLCTLSFCLAASSLPAQTHESFGSISGRVQHAVTGRYLPNVRVTVEGTTLETFTDDTGSFRLTQVPAGTRTLALFYTGLDVMRSSVEVSPDLTVRSDFSLTSREQYGKDDLVKLDPFVVTSAGIVEGQALALNEQRFAANLKNVVSTDTFGDITEGNIAEFMKFLPGVAVDYTDAQPDGVSIRGIGAAMTNVSIDGGQEANAAIQGVSRQFAFRQNSIADISRVEISKVPTPATPADSLAGSVNLVTKSAFERKGQLFSYRAYLIGNSDAVTLKKTAFPFEKNTYKVLPGFDFDYTLPITKDLGIVINALSSNQYSPQDIKRTVWNAGGTATNASPSSPFFQSFQIINAPKYIYRETLGGRLDWRATPNSVLTVGLRTSYYVDQNGNLSTTATVGTNANPTPTNGVRMSYDQNSMIGATGRGGVTMSSLFLYVPATTTSGNVRYRFDDGLWMIDASINGSRSRTWRKGIENGHFQAIASQLTVPVRVSFEDLSNITPSSIKVYNNANQLVNTYDINSYRVTTANQNSRAHVNDEMVTGKVDVRRQLNMFAFPASIQIGALRRQQNRDVQREQPQWTYVGINGNTSAAPLAAQVFANQPNRFGFDNIPWVSPVVALNAWTSNPSIFTKTAPQMVAQEAYRRRNAESIDESIDASYFQIDMKLLRNRLRILTGVRYEKTTDDGLGPLEEPSGVYMRNPDGSFVRDGGGNRVRKPEAGAAGTMQELDFILTERGYRSKRSYDGFYPSAHLTYNLLENLLVRLSYAQTYGRPDFDSVIPNSIINEFDSENIDDPNDPGGTITVRNTGLRPWSADNYDLSVEYYAEKGGAFTAGVFLKEIEDFFGDIARQATAEDLQALGLDPRYLGWTLRTKFNSGDARISGLELSARQRLHVLGNWGRSFEVFANATKLRLEGHQQASFDQFMPKGASWGVTYTRRPLIVMAKWNYRGEQRLRPVATMGPDAFNYMAPRTTMDLNVTYQVGKRFSVFASARNVFNKPYISYRYGSETPDYAKVWSYNDYGVFWTMGIKGQF